MNEVVCLKPIENQFIALPMLNFICEYCFSGQSLSWRLCFPIGQFGLAVSLVFDEKPKIPERLNNKLITPMEGALTIHVYTGAHKQR